MLPKHCSIMGEKFFNLNDECAARGLYFIVPPERPGTTQMAPSDVSNKSNNSKVRILVEQVIRRMETFHILSNELPISC